MSVFRLLQDSMEEGEKMETEKSEEGQGVTGMGEKELLVSIPLHQLRVPHLSPKVITKPLGKFKSRGIQAERGMIVDKDVRVYVHVCVFISEILYP